MIDFMLHVGCSIIIYLALAEVYSTKKTIILTLMVGIAKELFDYYYQHETFDLTDICNDIVGICLGFIIFKVVET